MAEVSPDIVTDQICHHFFKDTVLLCHYKESHFRTNMYFCASQISVIKNFVIIIIYEKNHESLSSIVYTTRILAIAPGN